MQIAWHTACERLASRSRQSFRLPIDRTSERESAGHGGPFKQRTFARYQPTFANIRADGKELTWTSSGQALSSTA